MASNSEFQPALLGLPVSHMYLYPPDSQRAHPTRGSIQRAPGLYLALDGRGSHCAVGCIGFNMENRPFGDDSDALYGTSFNQGAQSFFIHVVVLGHAVSAAVHAWPPVDEYCYDAKCKGFAGPRPPLRPQTLGAAKPRALNPPSTARHWPVT